MQFDVKSYSKDYYLDKKYMGSEILDTPDRETFGYMGRREEVLSEEKKLKKNGKKMKKGTVVVTELQMICGRLKK